jgi:hypothetical protein
MSPTEYSEIPVPPEEVARAVARESEPSEPVCEKRFVDDAVVEKRFVVVAFPNMFNPVHVLLSERSVEEAELPPPPTQVPPIEKQPAVRLMPPVE